MARESKGKKKGKGKKSQGLPVIHPDAAGIDLGAREIYVAVPADRAEEPVRRFETFTSDLLALAEWLRECGVKTVAMEATSVYWIPLFQILEERDFEVCLVNARYFQNVPGKRTDVGDCQWLQHLHAVGLLRGSFRPPQEICALRSLWRHRQSLVETATQCILHMHKSLDQMNVQIHHVLSDLTGVTGMAIVNAILAGERDPKALAAHRHPSVKASPEVIEKALVGDYRREHLFTLGQSLKRYRQQQELIAELDREVESLMKEMGPVADGVAPAQPPAGKKRRRKKPQHNEPAFDLSGHLYGIYGVDLADVPGISVMTAQVLLSEIGPDLSRFPTAAAFVSWLGLCPEREVSGGKLLSSKTRRVKNRAALALRVGGAALHRADSAIARYYRKMRARLGAPKAITAVAHKIARIIYAMLTTRTPYDETKMAQEETKHEQRELAKLTSKAKRMGFQLQPIPA